MIFAGPVCPSATAQIIPAELRERFTLLSIEAEDSIKQELAQVDKLKERNRDIEHKMDSLELVLFALQKEMLIASREMESLKLELADSEQDLNAAIYELQAKIKLMNMRFRDLKAQYDKYARRRLTHNQKRGLQLLGIMTAIAAILILLDANN